MASPVTPFQQLIDCVEGGKNFVLQGGAGSGKTETLKQLLEYISGEHPRKTVACITHTNLAVDEIKSRIEGNFTVSTTHSFLNSIIGHYKKNIQSVMPEVFKVKPFSSGPISDYEDENSFKKGEHDSYKKTYNNYASKLWIIKKEKSAKVIGKREYDKDPSNFNTDLNNKIQDLNEFIETEILARDFNSIKYNDTAFDDYAELTYGHDGLLLIAHFLFKKHSMLGRIIRDKFNFIFIDEYQDTNPLVVEIFLNHLPAERKATIGLFGDSMQAIYEDGVGDVESYIASGHLIKIKKEDNYRCSQPVIDLINKLRNDGLQQKMAFKRIWNDEFETVKDRVGSVSLVYAVIENRPHFRSSREEKDKHITLINSLISMADKPSDNLRHLKLTNRSISTDVGFKYLYDTFTERYFDPKDSIEKTLSKIQIRELYDLCSAYKDKNYNLVISAIKKNGHAIKKLSDKTDVAAKIDEILKFTGSAIAGVEKAFEVGLIKKSEAFTSYIDRKDIFLSQVGKTPGYEDFKRLYNSGENTFSKMKKLNASLEEDDFDDLESDLKVERFYNNLFSNEFALAEAFRYFEYADEKTKFITMHKTKGSGIDNVLVVLEEYFWNDYDFTSIYRDANGAKEIQKKQKNLKLAYVACSRTKHNLTCVKLITPEEEGAILALFKDMDIVKANLNSTH